MKKKKIFWSMIVMMMTMLSINLSACSSDDDDDDSGDGLSGTSWVSRWEDGEESETFTLNFKNGGVGTLVYKYESSYYGTERSTENFTYTYNSRTQAGTISIRAYNDSYGRYTTSTYEFEIERNKLYLYDEDGFDEVFTKSK